MSRIETESPVDVLARGRLLGQLGRETLAALAVRMATLKVDAGSVVLRKGEPGDRMMIVVEGRVKISSMSPRGTEVLFDMIEEGEVFGELSMIDGRVRSADATAVRPTTMLVLRREDLLDHLLSEPTAAVRLMEVLCDRLRRTNDMVESTVFLDLPARLVHRLQELAGEYGRAGEDGIRIEHGLSQQEIADSIGAARESVSKLFSIWRERGLITVARGSIQLAKGVHFTTLAE